MSVRPNSATYSSWLLHQTVVFPFLKPLLPRPNHRFPSTWFTLTSDPRAIIREVSEFLTLTSCMSFSSPVIGALIGKQEGRNIEVMNSFELLSHTVEEKIIIDKEYYYTKEEQCERGIEVGERSGRKKSKSWGRWRGLERNRPWEENGGNVKRV